MKMVSSFQQRHRMASGLPGSQQILTISSRVMRCGGLNFATSPPETIYLSGKQSLQIRTPLSQLLWQSASSNGRERKVCTAFSEPDSEVEEREVQGIYWHECRRWEN